MGLSLRPLEGMKNLKYDVVKASPPVLILDNKIKCLTLVVFFFFFWPTPPIKLLLAIHFNGNIHNKTTLTNN